MTPTSIVTLNDFGEDVDDPIAVIVAQHLSRRGLVNLEAVCIGTDPIDSRSDLGRGLLDRVGARDVPLGAGRGRVDEFWFGITPWVTPREFNSSLAVLRAEYERARDGSMTFVVCAPMKDLAEFLVEAPDDFARKTERVVIMGGVEMDGDLPRLVDGFMKPDTAKNNVVDMDAANFVYRFLQEREIKTTIVTRHAAYACVIPIPRFTQFQATGSEVGKWLVNGLREHFDSFWRNVNTPLGHPIRRERKMPDRQTREWFISAILKGRGQDLTANDSIYDLVPGVPVYDALAVIAAVPSLHEQFFSTHDVPVGGCTHQLIGLTGANPGVKDPSALVDFIWNGVNEQLTLSNARLPFARKHFC